MNFLRKNFTRLFIFAAIACLALSAMAQRTNMYTQNAVAPGGYNFWVRTPDGYYQSAEKHKWPLVIFLHGASLCGRNLNSVLRYGTLDAIKMGRNVPAVVIAPQNPGGAWKPSKLNDILDWASTNCDIDTNRVYVLGMSLGGYGTLDFAGSYPDRIAAAMALCGGCTLKNQEGLGKVPLWIMHGTADRAVALSQSTRVVNNLVSQGRQTRLRYDWLSGASHGALARIFYLSETYDWLFSHSLKDKGRPLNRTISITQAAMQTVYRGLNPGRRRK